jgi:hypothetical protein
MSTAREKAQAIVGQCTCLDAYKARNLTDPQCRWCDIGDEVIELIERYDRLLDVVRSALEDLDDDAGNARYVKKNFRAIIREAEEGNP